jgi:putative ABC transport system permease protein
MFRYLPLIVKNGFRNRRRSVLTICSVAASMCLLGLLLAMYHAFFFAEPAPESALRLVTRNRISLATVMPISYRERIKQVPGVKEAMVSQWFGGLYKEPRFMFARFAVEPEKLFKIDSEFRMPADQQAAFVRERSACIVGRKLANRFNFKIGDRITLVGDIFPGNYEFTVRGIYDSKENNENLYFNLEYLFQSLPAGRRDFAGTIMTLADSPDNVPRIAQQIDDMFRNAPTQTRTETEQQFLLGFLNMMGNVKMILLSICAAVTFTIILVCANTMAMSARERVKEVGVLKTLGFTNANVLSIILGEAAVISLLGGVFGWMIASGLATLLKALPGFFIQNLSTGGVVGIALLAVALLIGVVSSFIPAWNASRTTILEALRYSG